MIRSLAFAILIAAAPAAAAAQAPATAPAVDWTQRVEQTAEGGYRMGNPDAPVKLIEYLSITCSHCADFNNAASRPLRDRYVRSGRVSWEARPYLIFATDPGIFMLLQCHSPAQFFTVADELFATHAQWSARVEADQARLQRLPRDQRLAGAVRSSGVDRLFRDRGMTEAQIAACLSDDSALNRLAANYQRYSDAGVAGTPTFFINGQQVNAGTWEQLEPFLAGAGPGAGERGR